MIAASLRCSRANGIPFGLYRRSPFGIQLDRKPGGPAPQLGVEIADFLAATRRHWWEAAGLTTLPDEAAKLAELGLLGVNRVDPATSAARPIMLQSLTRQNGAETGEMCHKRNSHPSGALHCQRPLRFVDFGKFWCRHEVVECGGEHGAGVRGAAQRLRKRRRGCWDPRQDGLRLPRGNVRHGCRRQQNGDASAFPELARDRDRAAVTPDDPVHNGKA